MVMRTTPSPDPSAASASDGTMTVKGPGHMRSVRMRVSLLHSDAWAFAWAPRPTMSWKGASCRAVELRVRATAMASR